MKKYFNITLSFMIIMSGCVKHNQIDFTSSKAFFSSLNEKEVIQKKEKKNTSLIKTPEKDIKKTSVIKTPEKDKINDQNERVLTTPLTVNLSNYKKYLQQKIGFNEFKILTIFKNPSLKIKHGKIKNFQFHLKSCHLDLFFLVKGKTSIFRHFDIRPSSISSNLNKKECVKQLNNNFTLIHDPK